MTLEQLLSPQTPALWLLLTAILTTLLLIWRRYIPDSWEQRLWVAIWLLVPYFGLLLGGLSPRLMGLRYIDWSASLSLGSGLIFVVIVLLTVVRMSVALPDAKQPTTEAAPKQVRKRTFVTDNLHGATWQWYAATIAFSGVEEFHRAFLRGALWELLLLMTNPPELPAYWAIWIAAGIASFETLFYRPSFARWLFQNAILVTTSILFFYTHNFWLCWILNSIAQLITAPYGSPQLLKIGETLRRTPT